MSIRMNTSKRYCTEIAIYYFTHGEKNENTTNNIKFKIYS